MYNKYADSSAQTRLSFCAQRAEQSVARDRQLFINQYRRASSPVRDRVVDILLEDCSLQRLVHGLMDRLKDCKPDYLVDCCYEAMVTREVEQIES